MTRIETSLPISFFFPESEEFFPIVQAGIRNEVKVVKAVVVVDMERAETVVTEYADRFVRFFAVLYGKPLPDLFAPVHLPCPVPLPRQSRKYSPNVPAWISGDSDRPEVVSTVFLRPYSSPSNPPVYGKPIITL